MKRTVFAFVLLTFLGISHSMLLAQTVNTTTCSVTIRMQDSYGDGWNGNSLLLYHGDSLITTITFNSGSSEEVIVSLPSDSIRMSWYQGSWAEECSFVVESDEGETLYTSPSGMSGTSGYFATFVNICPSCPRPFNLHLISRTTSQLVLGWDNDASAAWLVEYGPYGFTRGTGTFLTTTSDTLSMSGLPPNSAQQVYVARLCDNGDTSRWVSSSFVTLCVSSACSYTVRLVDNYYGDYFYGQLLICHESGAVIDTVRYPSEYYSSYYEHEVSLCPGVLKLKYEPFYSNLSYSILQNQYMIVKDAEGDTVSFSNAYNTYYNANEFYDTIQYTCPSCLAVQGVTPTIIDSTTVSLSWRSTNAQQYLVSYKQNNGSLYDTITISDTTITLTGLQAATQYDVQIRGLCEGGDTSKIRSAHFTTGPRWYEKVYVSQTATADTLDGHSWATAVSSIAEAQQIAMEQAIYGNYPDIWVAEGTYYGQNTIYPSQKVYGGFAGTEAVDFDLSQRDLTAHATILDGQNYNYRVLYQNTDFTDSTRALWDGFTIQNGYQGAYLKGFSTLKNCIVNNNKGNDNGVGVYVENYTGTRMVSVENCKITNNVSYGYYGGGVCAINTRINNSLIAGNEAYYGGGVLLYGSTILHCDIVNNKAYYGAGLYAYSSTYDTVINSIIWNNKYAIGDSLPTQIYADYSNYLAISHSATTDSVTGIGNVRVSNSNWGHASGTNYVNFVNPEQGDYRLNPGSACIDAAYPISGFSNKDLAGNNRIYGNAPDMGCYENEGGLTCGTPFNLVLVNRTDTSATLQWDASSATSYTLQYTTAEDENWTTISSITNNQYTLSGLQEYTKYKVRVSSTCTAGTSSDYSDTFFFYSGCLNPIEPVNIGGSYNTVYYLPILTSYPYSTSHFLVKSSEMDNLGRTIDTIGFRFNSSSIERDIIIKIHQTTTNDLSWSNLYADSVNSRIVFQGRVNFASGGWTKIPLQYSYQTTGTSNLVISVFDTTGTEGNYGYFFYNTPGYTTLHTYGYGPGNMYGNYTTSYRPDIFLSGGCDMSSCRTPRMSVASVTDSSALIICTRLDGTQQVEIRLLGETDIISADNIEWQDSIVTLSSLLSNRTYEIRLRNICSDGDTSEWYTTEFTTLPMNLSRIYVKANAAGSCNGSCWTDAFTDLNNALQVAARCVDIYGTHPDIWVAAGTYYGDTSTTGNSAFTLVDGISIYGGFAGNEPADYDHSLRDITTNAAILDGRGQRRVVYQGADFTNSTTLSGFIVTQGYLNSGQGAGLRLQGNIRVEYCTISNNTASTNTNSKYGIGVYAYSNNSNRPVVIDHCTIKDNGVLSGSNNYGILYLRNANISNSVISGNQIYYRTIYSYDGNNQLVNSLISGNSARYYAGIYNYYASLQVTNCDIVSNTATFSSTPIYTYYSNYVTINNSVVWGNQAAGTPSYFTDYDNYILHNCAFDGVVNSIASVISLADSNDGTIDSLHYPRFVSPSEGDFSLMTGSALIDAGDSTYIGLSTDLLGNPRINFEQVDIGCYENNAIETCPRVLHLAVSSVGYNSAYITFQHGGNDTPSSYQIELSTSDTSWYYYGSTTQEHLFLTNLDTNQQYYVRVRSVCDDTLFGLYSRTVSFHTRNQGDCPPLIIGTTEATDERCCLPTNACYSQSYTQQLFTAEEMGSVTRTIDTIGFQYVYPYSDTRMLDIYLAHTSQSSLSSFLPSSGFELVFSGLVNFSNTGVNYWCNIPLQASFEYDGTSNLLVAIVDVTGSHVYCDDGPFRTHSTSGNLARYVYTNSSSAYNPSNPPLGDPASYRTNIRFSNRCQSDNVACPLPNLVVRNVTSNSAEVEWVANGQYDLQIRNATFDGGFETLALTNGGTLTGLAQNSSYQIRIRNVCMDISEASDWHTVRFTTLPSSSPIVYVTEQPHGIADGSSWDNATNDINFAQSVAFARGMTFGTPASVWVAAGTYCGDTTSASAFTAVEGVNVYGGFSGNEPETYDLTQRDFLINPTILDGKNQRRVLYQPSSFSTRTIWDGFTITRGYVPSTGSSTYGHGAYLQGGFSIRNCKITDNATMYDGTYQYGGGIYTTNANTNNGVIIDHCDISNNGYQNGSNVYLRGAGVYSSGNTSIINTRIHGNYSNRGALFINSTTYSYNTLIDHNKSLYNGAGVYMNTAAYIVNTTIVNNEIVNSSSYSGGGVYSDSEYYLRLFNAVVWGNKGTYSTNTDNLAGYYSTSYFNHSAIENFVGDNVINLASDNFGSIDSLNYPAFVSPDEGNYRLHTSSALINSGAIVDMPMSSYITSGMLNTDLSGLNRIEDDSIDMGCYEYHGEQYCLTPGGLAVSHVTENSAYLTWQDYGENRPEKYLLIVSDADDSILYADTAITNHHFLTNLTSSTIYHIRIQAACSDGNTGFISSPISFRTEAGCYEYTSIGTGSSSSTYYPSNNAYNYSYSQQIYTAEELSNQPQIINRVDYQLYTTGTFSRNIQLFMGHTSQSDFTSGQSIIPADSMQLVYSGNATFSNDSVYSWVPIQFDSNFHYDGTRNLVITLLINDNNANNYNYKYFGCHNTGYYSTHYSYRNTYPYDLYSSNLTVSSRTSYRSNIRISRTCEPQSCGTVNLVVVSIDTASSTFIWAGAEYQNTELQYKQEIAEDAWNDIVVSNDTIHIEGLELNTSYVIRIRQLCGDTAYSEYRIVHFTTLPSVSPIIYVAQQSAGTADGSSWDNAMSDINRAMDYAVARGNVYGTPAQVWVATGIYLGDTSTTGNSAFTMRAGVSVYGGFAGDEPANYDLSQRDLITNVTILDGRNQRRVLYQPSAFTAATHVIWDGFTIQNGQIGNSGAGAYLRAYSTLRNSIVKNNYSNGNSGGGVYAYGTSYNYYDDYGNFRSGDTPTIERCKLINNRGSNGGGAYLSYATLNNCLVANNTTTNYGGGIYANNTSLINSSTVVANDASSYGGVYCNNNSTLSNSIVWGNTSSNGMQLYNVNLHYSAIQDAASDTSSVFLAASNTGAFNSPHFVAPVEGTGYLYSGGNWQLTDSSICIGRGSNAYVTDTLDLVNSARIQQGTVDMGCYESPYNSVQQPIYSDNIVYVVDGGAGLMDGTSWQNAMPNLQDAINVASTHRFPVWVAEGTFYGNLAQPNAFVAVDGVDVYGGFVGDEPANYDISQRDLTAHPTILDGQNMQRVLYQPTNFNTLTTWDGLTIQNGRLTSGNGAGVFIYGNFIISNCIVRNNNTLSGNGAGVYKNNSSRSYITKTQILDNVSSGSGGGLYAYYTTVTNCRLSGNNSGCGAGVYASSSNFFYNCIIDHNSVSSYPGYGAVYSYNSNTFENCNVVNNTNAYSSTSGTGGVYASYSGSTFNNCIVWGNKRGYYVNNTQGTFTANSCAIEGGFSNGTNIINLASSNDGIDPTAFYVRFIDPDNGDYHLHATSPLIDAGDSTFVTQPIDYEGNARKYGGSVDIGAFESSEVSACPSVVGLHVDTVTSFSARLSWAPALGLRYIVQYGLQGSQSVDTISTNDTTISLMGLTLNRTYTVKVRVICDTVNMSLYSIPVNFATVCDTTLITPLSNFTSLSPGDSTVVYDQNVTFAWSPIPEADAYDFYIWKDGNSEPSSPTRSGLTTTTVSYSIPSFSYNRGVRYYWKVVARKECISKASEIQSIIVAFLPDLHVSGFTTSTPVAGGTMTVQWTVVNNGQGSTPPGATWYDYIWLTSEFGIGGFQTANDEILLASVPNLQSLAPGESYTNSIQIHLPDGYEGNYYLFVMANQSLTYGIDLSPTGGNAVPNPYMPSITGVPYPYLQSSGSGSYSIAETMVRDNFFFKILTILPQPTPDLQVTSITHPLNAFSGENINVSWQVSNQGSVATTVTNWNDAVYISSEPTFNYSSATLLGTVSHTGTLSIGDTYSQSLTGTIPIQFSGTYYIYVRTDISDAVYESIFETNNTTVSAQTVNVVMSPPADLAVDSIVFQLDTVSTLEQYTIRYRVTNIGARAIVGQTWHDAVYLSPDSSFAPNTVSRIGTKRHNGTLGIGESEIVSMAVTIPDRINGFRYLYVRTDIDDDIFEYTFEDNNIGRRMRPIRVCPPDLHPVWMSVPDTVDANLPFLVRWRIENVGDGDMVNRNFTDRITYNGATIYTSSQTTGINAGQYIEKQAMIRIPCGNAQSGQLKVTTDVNASIYESDESNNVSMGMDIALVAPDLGISNLNVADTLWSGTTIPVSWTLTNNGNAPIDAVIIDGFYLGDNTIFATSTRLEKYSRRVALNPGESIEESTTLALPNGISGTYYIHQQTNEGDNNRDPVCEGANVVTNISRTTPRIVMLSPYADLRVLQIITDDTFNVGQSLVVDYVVKNQGTGNLENTNVSTAFYLSAATVLNTNYATRIGTDIQRMSLMKDSSETYSAVLRIPTSLSSGNYYIFAKTDVEDAVYEYSGENNNTTRGDRVNIKVYPLDIGITSLQGNTTVEWGQTYTYTLTVTNNSEIPTLSYYWYDRLYLSSDNVLHGTDRMVGSVYHNGQLDAGCGYNVTFSVTIPYGTPSSYYLIAVADENNANPDINASNNVFVKPLTINSVPTPDLAISNVQLVETSVVSGQTARISYTVTNVGTVAVTNATWTDKLFLSTNDIYESSDIEIGTITQRNRSLMAGASYTDTIEYRVPLPQHGSFYLLGRTNSNNDFFEENTSNNIGSVMATITLPSPGDLVVSQVMHEDSVVSGKSIHINWDVRNTGENTLSGNGLRSLAYLSADGVFDANDRLLGTVNTNNVILPPGGSVSQNLSCRLSGICEGSYYVIVKTDVTNAFNEVNDTNNSLVSDYPVIITVRNLPFNTPVSDTLFNNQSSDFKLTVGDRTGETVRIHLESDDTLNGAVNMLYVSHNNIGDNLNYTYSTIGQFTHSPELYIPSTESGYYGINVIGSTPVGNSQTTNLSADILPFELREINPNMGGNNGKVTVELIGSRFRPDMLVWMRKDSSTTIVPDTVIYDNYYRAFATFNLEGKDTGRYSVGVVNYCEGEAILDDAFIVQNGFAESLSTNLIFPHAPRPNRVVVMMLEFGNIGGTDLEAPVVELESMGGAYIALSSDGLAAHQTTLHIPLQVEGDVPYLIRPGARGSITVFCYTSGPMAFSVKRVQ